MRGCRYPEAFLALACDALSLAYDYSCAGLHVRFRTVASSATLIVIFTRMSDGEPVACSISCVPMRGRCRARLKCGKQGLHKSYA